MKKEDLENGTLFIDGKAISIDTLPWNPHPTFKGVALKHIITGAETNGQLSCHLVRIEPNCEIGLHSHVGKTEIHEVMCGTGVCTIEQENISYKSGNVGFIPADKNHLVKADGDGLFLLAKFFPALL